MNMSVGRLWVLRLPIIWVLGAFTALGATGVWITCYYQTALRFFMVTSSIRQKTGAHYIMQKENSQIKILFIIINV